MSMFDEQYEYHLYINHYSCAIHFYNRDRGISFCYRNSISKCFTPPYILMHYGFITINGSRFTGPRCDKYLTNIIYSQIKHKHLAFNNLNTRIIFNIYIILCFVLRVLFTCVEEGGFGYG